MPLEITHEIASHFRAVSIGISDDLYYWIFPPSSGSFCGPVLLNAVSEAAFLVFSPA